MARTSYYVFVLVVGLATIIGAYFASRAGVSTELRNIIRRQDKADEAFNSVGEKIEELNRAIGRLEGRLNGDSR